MTDAVTNHDGCSIPNNYDGNGNLTQKTDARGVVTTYAYDGFNRVTARSYTGGTPAVAYTYEDASVANSKGRLTKVSSSVSTTSYGGYDAVGRAVSTTQTTALSATQTTDGQSYTVLYSYNLAGAIRSETYPSGRVVVSDYDAAGRLSGVKNQSSGSYYAGGDPSDVANRIQYTAHGAASVVRLGNGLWEHTAFNSRQQTTEIGLGSNAGDSSVLRLGYTYGEMVGGTLDQTRNNGNPQSQTITAPGLTATQSYELLSNVVYESIRRRFSECPPVVRL